MTASNHTTYRVAAHILLQRCVHEYQLKDSKKVNTGEKDIPLCHDVADSPCSDLVSEFFLNELYPVLAEVLRMGRAMQAKLHGDLHHQTTKHEGRVCGGAAGGERPTAEHT